MRVNKIISIEGNYLIPRKLKEMQKKKPLFTRKNWIDIQIAIMLVVLGFSLVLNVVKASDLN